MYLKMQAAARLKKEQKRPELMRKGGIVEEEKTTESIDDYYKKLAEEGNVAPISLNHAFISSKFSSAAVVQGSFNLAPGNHSTWSSGSCGLFEFFESLISRNSRRVHGVKHSPT